MSTPQPPTTPQPALGLDSLSAISVTIARARRFDDVVEIVAEEALSALGASSLSIGRWERDRGVLRTLINVGELGPGEERYPANEVYALSEYPLVAAVLQQGRPYRTAVDDPHADPASRELLVQLGKETDAAVPIMVEGRMWGELWATSARGAPRLDTASVEYLQAVAGHVAIGIVQAEYLRRLESLAFSDPLTGLANRRALDEALERHVPGVPGAGTALLMCDLDGLKPINDRSGHDAGDRALVRVADALREVATTVPGALAARTGGDEFALLLPGRTVAEAVAAAERLCAALAGGTPALTASVGIASTALGPSRPPDLLRAADVAQYIAKRAGPGRVRVADAATSPAATGASAGRRRLRDLGEAVDPVALTTSCLARLDALAGAPAQRRLAAVAAAVDEAGDLAGWTLWRRSVGGGLELVGSEASHGTVAPSVRLAPDDDPVARRVLATGVATLRPDTAAPANRTGAVEAGRGGLVTALLVAARGEGVDWLLELVADERTADLRPVVDIARLLALAAVAGADDASRASADT